MDLDRSGGALAIGAAFIVWWRQPAAVPVVEAVTKLTNDGKVKGGGGRLVTDGSRIYFLEGSVGSYQTTQVATAGGATAIIPIRFANFQFTALSQDGSYLLGAAGDKYVLPFWAVPLPTGEPRRLGSIESQDGDLLPDGRILFALGHDLYIADKDGSNPRRTLSASDAIDWPSVSPDGQRVVFTLHKYRVRTINEARVDGLGLHTLANSSDTGRVCCPAWTPDGRYIVYVSRYENRRDLWVLPMKTGFLSRRQQPIQLTNGPLSYTMPVVARDGKHVYAVGTEQRGELVRYDAKSKQFLPLLPGVAAFSPTFSRNGQWVAYTVFPDHALWRSRTDGTDPLQLTFSPAQVFYPAISPDGTHVVYSTSAGTTCLISMDGGTPQTLVETDSRSARWSPDGSRLVFIDSSNPGRSNMQLFDLRTGKRSVVPGSQGFYTVRWVADDLLVAITEDSKKLMIFDLKTQKWSDLVSATLPGYMVNVEHSPDYKYVYYTTGGPGPMAFRVRLADRQLETITSLKSLPLAVGPGLNTQFGVAADGSPVFARDIGTQEIYALSVKWP